MNEALCIHSQGVVNEPLSPVSPCVLFSESGIKCQGVALPEFHVDPSLVNLSNSTIRYMFSDLGFTGLLIIMSALVSLISGTSLLSITLSPVLDGSWLYHNSKGI